jgi:hypothetical protein
MSGILRFLSGAKVSDLVYLLSHDARGLGSCFASACVRVAGRSGACEGEAKPGAAVIALPVEPEWPGCAPVLINDIATSHPDDDFYDAKVTVLSEEIRHHVHEEEAPSTGMFAQCRKTDVDLVALRDRLMERKQQLVAQAKKTGLPIAKPSAIRPIAA